MIADPVTLADVAELIDGSRFYPPKAVADLGLASRATLATWRHRTRVTGQQHGPRAIVAGRAPGGRGGRVLYAGVELLRFVGADPDQLGRSRVDMETSSACSPS